MTSKDYDIVAKAIRKAKQTIAVEIDRGECDVPTWEIAIDTVTEYIAGAMTIDNDRFSPGKFFMASGYTPMRTVVGDD